MCFFQKIKKRGNKKKWTKARLKTSKKTLNPIPLCPETWTGDSDMWTPKERINPAQ